MNLPRDPLNGFHWAHTEDRASMCGPGLRVAWARMGVLWTHAILVPDENGLEIVRAVESDPDRDHPGRVVSPVYQEIQRHQGTDSPGVCFLATGTFFKHHFSAVITFAADPDRPDGLMLDVDVADRCRSAVHSLAATYTVRLDSGALTDAGPQSILWDSVAADADEGACRLEIEAIAPSTLVLAEAGRSATRVQVLAAIQPGGFTHRLHYRWRWASNSGLTR